MTLGKLLGTWHNVKQYAWFSCYRTETDIYHREEDTGKFRVFCKKGVGFYNYEKKQLMTYQRRATLFPARRFDSHIGPTNLHCSPIQRINKDHYQRGLGRTTTCWRTDRSPIRGRQQAMVGTLTRTGSSSSIDNSIDGRTSHTGMLPDGKC